jgi:hypothetical protein
LCHVIHVKPQQPIPGWSDTIGLYETVQQPELIVVGKKQDSAHWGVGEYGIVQEMATAASAVVLQTPYTQLATKQ